ncbi:MAG: hypothetical protein V2I57_07485 [Xanthomonadales bacterium]|jgi:hypothetical protein|nr:hypothetical protein [Xanthomonadales bacterium]
MIMKTTVAAAALIFAAHSFADERAISCNGCSEWQKEQAASRTIQRGKVTVFDDVQASVSRYNVFTEMLDLRPRTTWTSVYRTSVDSGLKQAWSSYVQSVRGVEHPGVVHLPDEFPMRSVAGALQDPSFTTTAIENHLLTLSRFQQLNNSAASLVSRALQLDLGVIDLKDILDAITIEVEFPDGSTMDYTITFSMNQGTGLSRLEVSPYDNAMGPDGLPAPTSALGFRNRTFEDRNGSLMEWISLARSFGIRVHQSGSNGTIMECRASGSTVVCTVRLAK